MVYAPFGDFSMDADDVKCKYGLTAEMRIYIMRNMLAASLATALLAGFPARAGAHFLELIPSTDIVDTNTGRTITLAITFTHPFERGPVMDMARPAGVGVLAGRRKTDLSGALVARQADGHAAWQLSYTLAEPGDHVFFVRPAAYWEPAEKKLIVHYTKVVVDAFGSGDGWDALVGLPVEIKPLVRPYGLWTGNLFRGVVLRNGKPVTGADVEVEWRNDGTVTAPADPFVTQVLRTDAQGQFAYAMPRAGWWAFAALLDGVKPVPGPDGKPVPIEEGALIWVRTVDMK